MVIVNQIESSSAIDSDDSKQELNYIQTVIYAVVIGTVGGLVATIYYFVLENLLEFVWETGKEFWLPLFPIWLPAWNYTWIIATIGGLLVGLCLYFLGLPGEMAMVIDKIHDPGRWQKN